MIKISEIKKKWFEFWQEAWCSDKYELTDDEKTGINSLYNAIFGNREEEKMFLYVIMNNKSEIRAEWKEKLEYFYERIDYLRVIK